MTGPETLTVPPIQAETRDTNPYVGPQPFQRQDSGRFFGRDQETNELLSLVIAHRVVVLYAPSGAGKTSLLNAALIPRLEEKEFEVLPPTRVLGPAEISHLEIDNIYTFQALARLEGEEEEPENLARLSIAGYLKEQGAFLDKYGLAAPRVLIFDQFEEFFTAYPARWPEREAFFNQLQEALETEPLLRVIFSLREDYLAQLEPYAGSMPDHLRRRFRLERMTPEAALEAVRGPLKDTNRTFTDEAAEKLVNELRKIRVESTEGTRTAVGKYIEPVQLQVVCQNLWQSLPPHITTITEKELAAYGDVTQALSQFYETALRDTVEQPGFKVQEKELRNWFENRLITPAGTRNLLFQDIESGLTGGIPNQAIHHLDRKHHIIRGEFRSGSRWYELTHDRFIDPIIAANQQWREKERERQRKGTRTGSIIVGIIFILVLAGMVSQEIRMDREESATASAVEGSRISFLQTNEAERAIATAESQTRTVEQMLTQTAVAQQQATATAQQTRVEGLATAVSIDQAEGNPDLYLSRTETLFPTMTAEERLESLITLVQYEGDAYAQAALDLFQSLSAVEQLALFDSATDMELEILHSLVEIIPTWWEETDWVIGAAWNSDGNQILTWHVGDTAHVWDATSGNVLFTLNHDSSINGAAWNQDGTRILTWSDDATARVWEAASGDLLLTLNHDHWVYSAMWNEDNSRILTGSEDGIARVWNAVSGNLLLTLDHSETFFSVNGAAWNGNENLVLTWSEDGASWWLWDAAARNHLFTWDFEGPVRGAAWSHDGTRFLTWSNDGFRGETGTTRVWDANTGNPLLTISHPFLVNSASWNRDGSRILTSSGDGTVRVWDVASGIPLLTLNHGNAARGATWNGDETQILTWSDDGTARIWDAEIGELMLTITGDGSEVTVARWSGNELQILLGTRDGVGVFTIVQP
jgi:WD40 repeat protein